MFVYQQQKQIPIENLPDLLEKHRKYGGRIIMYQSVWSAIVVSETAQHFVWVSKKSSRIRTGMKHSMSTLLVGWWSPIGLISTICALVMNFSGGVDFTSAFTASSPEKQDYYYLRNTKKMKRIRLYTLLSLLGLAIILVVLAFTLLPKVFDSYSA